MDVPLDDAVEIAGVRRGRAHVLVTCEHASNRLPDPWRWNRADLWLQEAHWAYDIGAADLARELAAALGTVAVLSRFSRLLADPNRREDAPDLFLRRAEGREVALNRDVDAAERELRLERLWRPYHAAVERELAATRASIVLAVHTFTPVYDGVTREVEVGVLFDLEEELAERVRGPITQAGFETRMNEPYSGKAGLIFAAHRHATAAGARALEIELRQDLAVNPAARARLVAVLAGVL